MVNFLMDDNQIEQVIINLLLNSVHAIDEKGIISITTKMDTERKLAVIEIQDNGYGIPKGKLKRIFEPFYTTKSDGTGLGLAVSYGIIKNHQGDIEVLSEPGAGTLISIELPIQNGKSKLTRKADDAIQKNTHH
jgi:signal transduction histidine kinase